nr:rhodanese-like domain-containing protein [Rhizocola hellebori]
MSDRHVQQLLRDARKQLRRRVTPRQAKQAQNQGAYLIDIRPEYQRRADGDIPTAIVVERNHLEWRLDPCSTARIPEAEDHGLCWIILCDQGYSSSLAAASLQAVGLTQATDVIGGFQRWRADGCPIVHSDQPASPRLHRLDIRFDARAAGQCVRCVGDGSLCGRCRQETQLRLTG